MGFEPIAKLSSLSLFVGSGALLDRRITLGVGFERRPLGRPGEQPQGFGGLAVVPSVGKTDETARRTRNGVTADRRRSASPRAASTPRRMRAPGAAV